MAHGHDHPVLGSGDGQEFVGQGLGQAQGVVAHRGELPGYAREQGIAVVGDRREVTMPRLGRRDDSCPGRLAEPLVPEAYAEHRDAAVPEDVAAVPEVAFDARASRAR